MKLTVKHEVPLAADVYIARVRGPQGELLINLDYGEVCSLSCPAGAESGRVAIPGGDLSIYQWHVSPGGDVSYLFGAEGEDFAVRMDHVQGAATKVGLPSAFGVPSGLAWWGPGFAILNTADDVWVHDGAAFRLASPDEADAVYTREFRRITRRYAVQKSDPYGRGAYVYSREYERQTIGFIPFAGDGAAALLAEHDGSAVDVSCWGDALFVSFEREIVLHRRGQSEVVFTPGEEEQIVRINVIESGNGAHLAVIVAGEDLLNAAKSRVTFLEVEVEPDAEPAT